MNHIDWSKFTGGECFVPSDETGDRSWMNATNVFSSDLSQIPINFYFELRHSQERLMNSAPCRRSCAKDEPDGPDVTTAAPPTTADMG
jgi:hypothetical protein